MENGSVLIDTSILIDFYRKKNVEKTLFYQLSGNYDFALSIISEFEFLVGFPEEKLDFAKEIIKGITIFEINKIISEEALKIYKNLKKINKLIPFTDLFIAATAVSNKIPLATLNKKHFKYVEGIELT
ncbi:MAG: type II toxin-antitoxin system VapC family toxin [bacterium]